jgi:hypothetical protein
MAVQDQNIMSGTGAGLIAFYEAMSAKGRLPKARAMNYRLATQQVLEAVFDEEWEQVDMRNPDLEDVFARFVNLKAASYSDNSFASYKSRFNNGVTMYRDFLKDPAGWKAPVKVRTAAKKAATNTATNRPVKEDEPSGQVKISVDTTVLAAFINHTFPLRQGVRATLSLPEDLTGREAKRLANFIESLAVDEQLALPRGGD